MTNDTFYDLWKDIVAKVAKKVARSFPETEPDDLYQELWLWLEENKPEREQNNFAFRTLELVANDVAWKLRREYLAATGRYLYRPQDVRTIVAEYLFNPEYWKKSIVIDEQPLPNGDRGSTNLDFEDRVAVFADVAAAFKHLPEPWQEAIIKRFQLNEELTNAENIKVTKAIDRMADYLNYTRRDYGTN